MGTRLDGCFNRFGKHVNELSDLVAAVQPCLLTAPPPVAQRVYLAVLIQLQSSFEVLLQCLVVQASFWKADEARDHLIASCPDQEDNIPGLNLGQLASWAASEIDFKKRAKRLRGIVKAVLGVELFPDPQTDSAVMDLVAVRNIAIHQMAHVDESNARTVSDPDVIVQARQIGESRFYELVVSPPFLIKCFVAVKATVVHLATELAKDPIYVSDSVDSLLKGDSQA